jgi:hypothetical protein
MKNITQWTLGLYAAGILEWPSHEGARTGSLFNYEEPRPDDASSKQADCQPFPHYTIPAFSKRGTLLSYHAS